jgi:hypothetical protein
MPGDNDPCSGGGGSGGWVPVPVDETQPQYIINELTNRCLNMALLKLTSTPSNSFFNEIYNVFDTATSLHLTFGEAALASAYGICSWSSVSGVGPFASIQMDTTVLLNCSQEYMAYVFLHEVTHAAMFANLIVWDTTNTQHEQMMLSFLTKMANTMMAAFPGLSKFDAYAMCYNSYFNAIDGNATADPSLLYIMLTQIKSDLQNPGITAQQLIARGEEYKETGTLGIRLNCH